MRKVGFILLLFSFMSGALFAQKFDGSLLIGINGSQVDGDGIGGYDKFGIIAGGAISYPITDKISGMLELKYNRKGQVRNPDIEEDGDNATSFKTNLHYVQLPVLMRYQLPKNFSLQIGVGLAYLVDYSFFDEYGSLPKEYVGFEFDALELSSILGIRYDLTDRWYVDGRWSMSVFPVANVYNGEVSGLPGTIEKPGNAFNRSLELMLGYKLGKR